MENTLRGTPACYDGALEIAIPASSNTEDFPLTAPNYPSLEDEYKSSIKAIRDAIESREFKALKLISPNSVRLLYGVSGSGKSLSIDLINKTLPEGQRIYERNINKYRDADEAYKAMVSEMSETNFQGTDYSHIFFTTVWKNVADGLAKYPNVQIVRI